MTADVTLSLPADTGQTDALGAGSRLSPFLLGRPGGAGRPSEPRCSLPQLAQKPPFRRTAAKPRDEGAWEMLRAGAGTRQEFDQRHPRRHAGIINTMSLSFPQPQRPLRGAPLSLHDETGEGGEGASHGHAGRTGEEKTPELLTSKGVAHLLFFVFSPPFANLPGQLLKNGGGVLPGAWAGGVTL